MCAAPVLQANVPAHLPRSFSLAAFFSDLQPPAQRSSASSGLAALWLPLLHASAATIPLGRGGSAAHRYCRRSSHQRSQAARRSSCRQLLEPAWLLHQAILSHQERKAQPPAVPGRGGVSGSSGTRCTAPAFCQHTKRRLWQLPIRPIPLQAQLAALHSALRHGRWACEGQEGLA